MHGCMNAAARGGVGPLVCDGLGMHIPKGYIYFAMGFSVCVEMVNLRVRGGFSPARPG